MKKLNKITKYDTYELCQYAQEKYGMTNNEWHKKVWSPYMCNDAVEGYLHYTKTENPENILQEQINDFLDDYPELNGEVTFEFTD